MFPLMGFFPVISQTLAMVVSLFDIIFKNGVQRTVFFFNKTNEIYSGYFYLTVTTEALINKKYIEIIEILIGFSL